MITKQDIIRWYYTSIIPSDGTEELNVFMTDIAVAYDYFHRMPDGTEVGIIYKNLTKAMKAYAKYGFTEVDILKMYSNHLEIVSNNIKLKSVPGDYEFIGFRHKVPNCNTKTIMKLPA